MFALVFIYSTSLLFHLTPLEQSVTSTLQLFTNCLVWKHFSINTFNSFIRIFLRDKQNNPRRKKFKVVQAMRLSCCCFLNRHLYMLTVSVTCPYFGGFIYTYRDIIFLKLRLISPFLPCLPFTHKRRFCATKTLVLGLVHTYSNIFENGEIYLPLKKNKKETRYTWRILIVFADPWKRYTSFSCCLVKHFNISGSEVGTGFTCIKSTGGTRCTVPRREGVGGTTTSVGIAVACSVVGCGQVVSVTKGWSVTGTCVNSVTVLTWLDVHLNRSVAIDAI